ncbi:MAG TPA: stage II sporulation protein M [Acidobacteriaceae bacterium]|jgi:uncharacterized membrane protein SpoIIM required for sporulation
MISNQWIEKRRPYWERLATLAAECQGTGVRRLGRDELRELALLYRQVANDLSVVRQDETARSTAHMLNQLLGRTHNIIYSSRQRSFRGVVAFLAKDYPRHFRRLLPYTLTAVALFAGGLLLGAILTLARHGFMESFLGPSMVATIHHRQMWTHSIVGMKPQESSRIMTNNLTVTFITFAAGITAGVGTVWLIFFNGLLMGVIATACQQAHMSRDLWSFVCPHGALELPAIFIAGGAGLRLASGMLFPGIYSRRDSIARAGSEAIRLVAGIIPMLIVAGSIEGFFSPSGAPAGLKFGVGAALFALLLVWLFSSIEPGVEPVKTTAGPAPSLPDNG